MMMRAALAFATTVALAGNAAAEPQPLATVLSGIHGQEVRLAGQFGRHFRERNLYEISAPEGRFAVELALGRDQLKSLDKCQSAWPSNDKSCDVEMLAEVKVDAGRISLIAYQITVK